MDELRSQIENFLYICRQTKHWYGTIQDNKLYTHIGVCLMLNVAIYKKQQ